MDLLFICHRIVYIGAYVCHPRTHLGGRECVVKTEVVSRSWNSFSILDNAPSRMQNVGFLYSRRMVVREICTDRV